MVEPNSNATELERIFPCNLSAKLSNQQLRSPAPTPLLPPTIFNRSSKIYHQSNPKLVTNHQSNEPTKLTNSATFKSCSRNQITPARSKKELNNLIPTSIKSETHHVSTSKTLSCKSNHPQTTAISLQLSSNQRKCMTPTLNQDSHHRRGAEPRLYRAVTSKLQTKASDRTHRQLG